MYEYKFVKVELKTGFITMKPKADYHEIINKHVKDGWRLVQIFAPEISAHGNSSFFEIILEKTVD